MKRIVVQMCILWCATLSYSRAQLPMGGLPGLEKELKLITGQITPKEATQIVEKLYLERILNQEGRRVFNTYIKDRKNFDIFEKKPKTDKDSSVTTGLARQLLMNSLSGFDSLAMNRHSFLFFLGMIDLSRITGPQLNALKVPMGRLKPILGSLWSFTPLLESDAENNPFSYKYKLAEYRQQYNALLDALNRTGLLKPKVYAECQEWLKKEEVFMVKDFSLFLYAGYRSMYYDMYPLIKRSQESRIDSLRIKGLMDQTVATKLKALLVDNKLLSKTDILGAMPNAFSMKAVSSVGFKQKKQVTENLFKQVSVLIPDLKISDVQIKEIPNDGPKDEGGLLAAMTQSVQKYMDRRLIEVSANFNGKRYIKHLPLVLASEEMFPDSAVRNSLGQLMSTSWLSKNDLQILNDYLSDANSDKRLVVAGDEVSIFPSPSRTTRTVLLVNKDQMEMLKKSFFVLLGLGSESDYDGQNSVSTLKKAYEDLLKTAMISPMTDAEVEKVIFESRKMVKATNHKEEVIYEMLKTSKGWVKGKVDLDKLKAGYVFIDQMKQAAKGAFFPSDVFNNFDDEYAKVDTNSRVYRFGFKVKDKVFQDSLLGSAQANSLMAMFGKDTQLEDKMVSLIVKSMGDSALLKPYTFTKGVEKHYIFLNKREYEAVSTAFEGLFAPVSVEEEETAAETSSQFDTQAFIEELKSADMLDAKDATAIFKDYPAGLTETKQAIPYLKNRVEFDMRQCASKTSVAFITDLYQLTQAQLLKEVKLTTLVVKEDSTASETIAEYNIGGINYRDKFTRVMEYLDILRNALKSDSIVVTNDDYSLYLPEQMLNPALTDMDNDRRLVWRMSKNMKLCGVLLTQDQEQKVTNYSMFNTLKYDGILEFLTELKQQKFLVSTANDNELVMKYRELSSNLLSIITAQNLSDVKCQDLLSFYEETSWIGDLEMISGNTVKIEKFKSNYASINKQIDAQYDLDEEKRKSFLYNGEFVVKGKKVIFSMKLTNDNGYKPSYQDLVQKIFKPINAQLGILKNPKAFYMQESGFAFFITKAQKAYAETRELVFVEAKTK